MEGTLANLKPATKPQTNMQSGATTRERRKSAVTPRDSTPTSSSASTAVVTATVKRRKCGTSPFDEHWLNLDCCGLFCAVLTYGLHVYGCYAVCFLLIPPWMSNISEENVRSISIMGKVHMLCFCGVALFACLSHFKAMTTDPGAVPPDAKPLPDPEDVEEGGGEAISTRGKRLCRRCHAFKPQRAHHCSVCKRCIIKMDHHCPWVNNCVGIGNHKYFLLFVFYTFLSCTYSMSLLVSRFLVCMHKHGRHQHCLDQPTHLLNILGLFVESMLFGLFTCCMMFDQWDVVYSNMTHIDRLKGEMMAAVERVPGVMEVFGAGRRGARAHFRMDWLSPFGDVMFPPSLRDQILGYCRPCCNKGPEREVVVDVELTTPLASPPPSRGGIVKSVTEIV